MKYFKIIIVVFFGLIFSTKVFASDTTAVIMEQMNDYFKINGISKANISYKNYYFIAKIINNSKIYSKNFREGKLKNEFNSILNFSKYLFENFSTGIKMNYFILSDEHINYSNDYSKMLLGVSNQYNRKMKYIFDLGYLSENRLTIGDDGYFVNLKIRQNKDFKLKPFSDMNYEKTNKRTNYKFDNRLSYKTDINNIKNIIKGGYKVINREYFVDETGSNIEKRINEKFDIRNSLTFPLSSNSQMTYDVEYVSNSEKHRFSYADSIVEREYERFEFDNKIMLVKKHKKFKTALYLSNEYKQYNSKATSEGIRLPVGYTFDKKKIKFKSSYQLSKNDSVEVNYFVSLLNFDTPDTSNYDERDEVAYSINVGWRHKINPFLQFSIYGDFYFHHLVYLYRQRSAQNHSNRIVSLKSDLILNIPKKIVWRSHQEIYTNYFVYDYEYLPFVHINSMVFRGLKLNQNVKYYFVNSFGINLKLFVRWEDNGFLDWDNFYQEITNDKFEYKISTSVFKKLYNFSVNIGPSYSQRFEYVYNLSDEKDLSYYSYRKGVNFSINYKRIINIRYNIQNIQQKNRESYYNNSGLISVHFVI